MDNIRPNQSRRSAAAIHPTEFCSDSRKHAPAVQDIDPPAEKILRVCKLSPPQLSLVKV